MRGEVEGLMTKGIALFVDYDPSVESHMEDGSIAVPTNGRVGREGRADHG